MIEKIEENDKILAIILRGSYKAEGVSFITDRNNSFQVGMLSHKRGARIKPHMHKSLLRKISDTQEVLHIEQGAVEVEFYNENERYIGKRILNSDDTILLISGGHGFNMLEDARIIEIKQGPYDGKEKDKTILGINKGA